MSQFHFSSFNRSTIDNQKRIKNCWFSSILPWLANSRRKWNEVQKLRNNKTGLCSDRFNPQCFIMLELSLFCFGQYKGCVRIKMQNFIEQIKADCSKTSNIVFLKRWMYRRKNIWHNLSQVFLSILLFLQIWPSILKVKIILEVLLHF